MIVSGTDPVYLNTRSAIELTPVVVVVYASRKRIQARPLCGIHECRRHESCQILRMTNGCK